MRLTGSAVAVSIAAGLALTGCGGRQHAALPPQTAGARTRLSVHPAGESGFAGTRATFEHSLVCDNGVLIANYAKQYGITTIFVPVGGDDIGSLLAGNPTTVKNLQAMMSVATVYMVSGDVSWLSSPTSVPADVPNLGKIAAMYPSLGGILYAVDPEQSAQWNTGGRQTVIQNYFTLVQTLLDAPAQQQFAQTWFLAHADFGSVKVGNSGSTMLQDLESSQGLTGVDLLVPGNSAATQFKNVQNDLSQLVKPFWVESSAVKYNPAGYYGKSPSYLKTNQQQLAADIEAQSTSLAGLQMNGWSDLYDSLQSILPQPPVFNGVLPTGPLVPAAGTTYLGAYVNPNGTGQTPAQTLAFETSIGRTLAYNMHFYGFRQNFPGSQETDDIQHGRIPVIAWNCGDTDARIASGADDGIITTRAKALKAFGAPVMVRWFWEANLNDTNDPPRTQCYDPNTDLPDGYFSPEEYIAAWRHVHQLFVSAGATNVVWLWCVANAHGGPSQYYPGDDVVDWVGIDDYDDNNVSMQSLFYIPDNELAQFQEKPFMVTETGAHPNAQSVFLTNAASVLQNDYPWIRALGYLDSKGTYQNWVLTQSGLSLFTTFAQSPYMSAMYPGG